MAELIGPLTAEEWCSFRLTGDDDDIFDCCNEASDVRDRIFNMLRMGGDAPLWGAGLRFGLERMSQSHEGPWMQDSRIRRLYTFLGGDPDNWAYDEAEYQRYLNPPDDLRR